MLTETVSHRAVTAPMRRGSSFDPSRARFLSLRVSTLVKLHGVRHAIVRAHIGRYYAASGMVPQLGHRLWADDAFVVGFAREAGTTGHGNRTQRRAAHRARSSARQVAA